MRSASPRACADIGHLLDLPAGRVQIREDGPDDAPTTLLLVHVFAGSMRSWDTIVEPLAAAHRVVRLDLLGHGGSEKPHAGYSMEDQASTACGVLDALGIDSVVAVGHSGGGDIVCSMIEHHRRRIDGAILIGTPPNLSYVHLPLTARLLSARLLGPLLWRLTSDRMIAQGLARTYAPGFGAGPDVFVEDLKRMTHHSYVQARAQVEGYRERRDLTLRVRESGVPLMIVFGEQDQWVDPRAVEGWASTTDARIELLRGVGHTPMVEAPRRTAELIEDFAAARSPDPVEDP
jgi:pimeloyl-ACP methyl ester carboxylesterase